MRRLILPIPLPCFFACSVTAPLYSTTICQALRRPLRGSLCEQNGADLPKIHIPKMPSDVCSYLLLSVVLCLDILMNGEADLIKEIRYLAALMHQNCHDASWRIEQLLSKVEQGKSLDSRGTSIQLREARDELQLLMRSIEGIQKLCELESDDT
jgi:hypothetical protein